MSLDDDIESDEEECDVSKNEAGEPSDEVSDEDIETETKTTDTDTNKNTSVSPERYSKNNHFS